MKSTDEALISAFTDANAAYSARTEAAHELYHRLDAMTPEEINEVWAKMRHLIPWYRRLWGWIKAFVLTANR